MLTFLKLLAYTTILILEQLSVTVLIILTALRAHFWMYWYWRVHCAIRSAETV